MVAATAAFSDSQWLCIGMMTVPSAASSSSRQTPCPSEPMITAVCESVSSRRSCASARSAVASRRTPFARQLATAASRVIETGTARNAAPIDARTTFGFHTSAQPGSSTTGTASASAVRKIVPRLPGS